MPPTHARPLFFLHHRSAAGSSDNGQLNAEARAHVSRQALLKAAKRPKTFQFRACPPGAKPHRNHHRLTSESNDRGEDTDDRRLRVNHRCRIPLSPKKAASFDPFDTLDVPEPAREEQFLLHYGELCSISVERDSLTSFSIQQDAAGIRRVWKQQT